MPSALISVPGWIGLNLTQRVRGMMRRRRRRLEFLLTGLRDSRFRYAFLELFTSNVEVILLSCPDPFFVTDDILRNSKEILFCYFDKPKVVSRSQSQKLGFH